MVKKKTKNSDNFNAKLAVVMATGKYKMGYKSTLRTLRSGTAKLLVVASNTAQLRRSEIEYYAMLAKCDVHHFQGGNAELGKHFPSLLTRSESISLRLCPISLEMDISTHRQRFHGELEKWLATNRTGITLIAVFLFASHKVANHSFFTIATL